MGTNRALFMQRVGKRHSGENASSIYKKNQVRIMYQTYSSGWLLDTNFFSRDAYG